MYKLDLEHSNQHNIFKGIVNEVLKCFEFEIVSYPFYLNKTACTVQQFIFLFL